jgi:hypothetical protein
MKRLMFLLMAVCFTFSSANAQTFGVGWDNGYSIKVPVQPVCIQLTGKFDSVIPENDDLDNQTKAEIAAYVLYPVMNLDKSKLNVFGGLGLIPTNYKTTDSSVSYDKELDFLFRFGIEPETMINDHIGVSAKVGLQVYMDQGYDGLDDSGSTDLDAWGSVGMHWYF